MSVKESDVEMVRAAKAARNTRNLALALHSAEMEGGHVSDVLLHEAHDYANGLIVRSERQIIHTDERTGVRTESCYWYGFIAQSFRCAHATGIGGDRAFACHGEALELMDDLPVPDGTVAQLRSIHRFLSQDVYDWPGRSDHTQNRPRLSRQE